MFYQFVLDFFRPRSVSIQEYLNLPKYFHPMIEEYKDVIDYEHYMQIHGRSNVCLDRHRQEMFGLLTKLLQINISNLRDHARKNQLIVILIYKLLETNVGKEFLKNEKLKKTVMDKYDEFANDVEYVEFAEYFRQTFKKNI